MKRITVRVTVRIWHSVCLGFLYWGYQLSCMSQGSPMVSWEDAQYYHWLRKHQAVCPYCGQVLDHAADPFHAAGECTHSFS